jgi:hypothetical protein
MHREKRTDIKYILGTIVFVPKRQTFKLDMMYMS